MSFTWRLLALVMRHRTALVLLVAAAICLPIALTVAAPRVPQQADDAALPVAPAGSGYSWYFAAGTTRAPYRTAYTLWNPGDRSIVVSVDVYVEGTGRWRRSEQLPAGEQRVLYADAIMQSPAPGHFAARLTSQDAFFAEQVVSSAGDAMAMAGTAPATRWYFPALTLDDRYDVKLWTLNDSRDDLTVTLSIIPQQGSRTISQHVLAAQSCLSLPLLPAEGLSGPISAIVEAERPLAAGYSVVYGGQAFYGGTGQAELSKTWYVPLANGQDGFEQTLSLFNPSKDQATSTIQLLRDGKVLTSTTLVTPGGGRADARLRDALPANQRATAVIESNRFLAVSSLVMYRDQAAYAAEASPGPARRWFFAGLPHSEAQRTYLAVYNPGQAAATVVITYSVQMSQSTPASLVRREYPLPARGWMNQSVEQDLTPEIKSGATPALIGIEVVGSRPVVVERLQVGSRSAMSTAGTAMRAEVFARMWPTTVER